MVPQYGWRGRICLFLFVLCLMGLMVPSCRRSPKKHQKIDELLSFADVVIHESSIRQLVWSVDANEQHVGRWVTKKVTGNEAVAVANRFRDIVMKHLKRTSAQVADVLLMYELTFSADDQSWLFQFGFPGGDIAIAVPGTDTQPSGTVVIAEIAQTELENLLEQSFGITRGRSDSGT